MSSEVKIHVRADGTGALATFRQVQKGVGNISHELNSTLKGAVIAAFSVEAIKATVEATIEWADQITKASERLGLTTDNVQALRIAAKEAGTDFEKLEGSLGKMELAAAAALGGKAKQKGAFSNLGISDEDLKHLNKTDLLAKVGKGAQGMTQSQAMANLAPIFGAQGASSIFAMRDKLANFNSFKEGKKASGEIANGEDLQALSELKNKWEQVANAVKAHLVPMLTWLLDKLFHFGRGVRQLVEIIGTAIGAFIGSIEKFDIKGFLSAFGESLVNTIKAIFTNAWALIRGKKTIEEVVGDVSETMTDSVSNTIGKTFGENVMQNTAEIINDKLVEQGQDDIKLANEEAKKKADIQAKQAEFDKDPDRQAAPGSKNKKEKSLLDNDLKSDNGFLKIGGLLGVNTTYRLERLSQKTNELLQQIVKNTSPDTVDNTNEDFNP